MPNVRYRGKRADGQHRWDVRVYDAALGRQVSRAFTTGSTSTRTAERRAEKIVAEIRAAADDRPASGTVAELVDDWQRTTRRNVSPSTRRGEARHIAALLDRLGSRQVDDLKGRDLDRWYGDLMDGGRSIGDVHHLHRVVRSVLRWGVKKRDHSTTAYEQVTLPKYRAPEIAPPDPFAVGQALNELDGDFRAAVTLLAATGMRRGEVVAVAWSDIDGGYLTIRRAALDRRGGGVEVLDSTKGGRSRRVPLTAMSASAFNDLRDRHAAIGASPWVLPDWRADPTGQTPRRPGWLSQMWAKRRDQLGLSGVRLHDLRHSFATIALETAPLHGVQGVLGHAKASTTTDIYGHRTDGAALAAVEAVERALTAGSSSP